MKGCGRTLDFGCFLDFFFSDTDLVKEEREEEERAMKEELEVRAFTEGISVGTKPATGMKAKNFDEVEGSDFLKEEGVAKGWPHFD